MDINEKILQELVSFKGEFSTIHLKLDDVICRISSVENRVTSIEEKVDEIKEELDIVHGAVNEVGKWCEQASEHIQIPYMKKAQ